MAEKIPSWPKVTIRLYDDHNAEVKIAGRSHPVNHHDPRAAAIQLVSEQAAQLGRAVKATAVEADGASWPLVIHPDGQVDAIDTDPRKGKKPIWPIVLAMAVAVVLIAGTTLYITVFSKLGEGTPQVTESPKLPELPGPNVHADEFAPRTQPTGYSSHASWTVDLAEDSTPAIKPDGTEIAILTTDEKVAVFDANGKVLWQDKVPKDAENPVYTTIDGKQVLAIATPSTLYYWAGGGAEAKTVELPDSAKVQFFGKSPLILLGDESGAMVISGGELKTVPDQPRSSTILLAEGDRTLMAQYLGPLYWTQPGKKLLQVNLQPPGGAGAIIQVVSASPDYALALWTNAKNPEEVIPAVHSTASGKMVASCGLVRNGDTDGWDWVPDPNRKFAAWGECLVNLTLTKANTRRLPGFQPLSVSGSMLYGTISSQLWAVSPNWNKYSMKEGTTRPWGVIGKRAVLVYNSVLYALDPGK
ncbi:hypothetical protein [Kribbella speibonae]|uniref:Uncharacterized protein n=1 Tax=Kribbella speibonae TaxID=1572660 RepID=A0A4V2M5N2_9ACTN|nr:hypothetical protein [Kribbella speibonae]TCC19001.1 hypothetical protein E0H58_34725 [Kribbella speibonae]TCC40592.1 hypothetical protein E0H92_02505 [Kribbella speibonae]